MQQKFEILELRIAQMIEQVKTLRSERASLQVRVEEQEKISRQQNAARRKAIERVTKVLEALNPLAAQQEGK